MKKLTVSRREALERMGTTAAGVLVAPHVRFAGAATESVSVADLARRLRDAAPAKAFDVATEAIRAGADHHVLLGAAFLVGIQDVEPRHVGGKLHCVMMVESMFQLGDGAAREDALRAALWNIDDLKRAQAEDRADGTDWELPPRPSVSFASKADARREFLAAMEAWEPDAADRALVGLLPYQDVGSMFEILWPLAARCYVNIGHKIIFAAQVERVLRRIGWEHAEPALRSLTIGLLFEGDGPQTQAFSRSQQLASSIPLDWLGAREDPMESLSVLRVLRESNWKESQQAVIDAMGEGVGPNTIWDGIRLYASELFLRRSTSDPGNRAALLPVHAVTVPHSMAYAWRATERDDIRRLLILQAAAWVTLLEKSLDDIVGLKRPGSGIDGLGREVGENVDHLGELWEKPRPNMACALLDRKPESRPAYIAHLRDQLLRKAVEHHQHKYAAAMMEESRTVHPRWASRMLAPAVPYLPGWTDPVTELEKRIRDTLRKAGVVR